MIKLLKDRGGMTLLELFVGMVIFTVIAVTSAAILASTVKAYDKANDLAEVNTLMDDISNEMLGDLWQATEVSVNSSGTLVVRMNNRTVVYGVGTGENEGLLCRGLSTTPGALSPVLDRVYYKGKTIGLEYLDSDDKSTLTPGKITDPSFIIRVNLYPKSPTGSAVEAMTSREYAVRPIGMKDYSE